MTPAAANTLSSWDRAIAYGDGLFETILVIDSAAPLWGFHYARLQESIKRLAIDCDLSTLESSLLALATQNADALIKIIIARCGGARGYDARRAAEYTVDIKIYPTPRYSRTRIDIGVRLHVCRQRLSHNPALAGIKHLNRLEQVLAASEWDRNTIEEGLMLDNTGAVIEGTISNIFILRDGKLVTPSLKHCGVAGVMRAAIMQKIAPAISLPTEEARLTLDDMLNAEAVFICNSVFGVWPVKAIGVSQIAMNSSAIEKIWRQLTGMGYAGLYD